MGQRERNKGSANEGQVRDAKSMRAFFLVFSDMGLVLFCMICFGSHKIVNLFLFNMHVSIFMILFVLLSCTILTCIWVFLLFAIFSKGQITFPKSPSFPKLSSN